MSDFVDLPDESWDSRQAARSAHMLQSRAWACFQSALGRPTAYDEGDDWSWVGHVMGGRGYSYLYVPYGPTLSIEEALKSALDSLSEQGRRLGCDFVRCEPILDGHVSFSHARLRPAAAVQPRLTRVVELDPDEDELHRQLQSGHRSAVNQAAARGVNIAVTSELSELNAVTALLKVTADTRRFRGHVESYYETMLNTLVPLGFAKLGLAHVDAELVSCAVVFDHDKTRVYGHAGNSPAARKVQSSVPLVWTLMVDARQSGLRRFDLWGVADPSAVESDPWYGFSKFKRGFGGYDLEYAGTWDLVLRPLKAGVIAAGRVAARRVRRIRR